jgi:CcmD family protein
MLEFMSANQLYIVLGIVMLVWFGIIFYLFRLDRKVQRLEDQIKKG